MLRRYDGGVGSCSAAISANCHYALHVSKAGKRVEGRSVRSGWGIERVMDKTTRSGDEGDSDVASDGGGSSGSSTNTNSTGVTDKRLMWDVLVGDGMKKWSGYRDGNRGITAQGRLLDKVGFSPVEVERLVEGRYYL